NRDRALRRRCDRGGGTARTSRPRGDARGTLRREQIRAGGAGVRRRRLSGTRAHDAGRRAAAHSHSGAPHRRAAPGALSARGRSVIDVDATPDALSQIEAILREEIGLDTATVGRSLVLRAAQRRIRRCAIGSIEAYADRLCADAQELQELVEEVVVPETYFFREPDAIADVARRVRDMLALPGASTPVRILSVPCSTGEEPYSIAMALLMEGLSPESVAIDAIDVSFEA